VPREPEWTAAQERAFEIAVLHDWIDLGALLSRNSGAALDDREQRLERMLADPPTTGPAGREVGLAS
jgi:hypothetical protein